jgi:hypothetical protein
MNEGELMHSIRNYSEDFSYRFTYHHVLLCPDNKRPGAKHFVEIKTSIHPRSCIFLYPEDLLTSRMRRVALKLRRYRALLVSFTLSNSVVILDVYHFLTKNGRVAGTEYLHIFMADGIKFMCTSERRDGFRLLSISDITLMSL